MPHYHLQGSIMLESTREESEYDFEDYFDYPPTEMDVLNRMIQSGEIQIIHEHTEEIFPPTCDTCNKTDEQIEFAGGEWCGSCGSCMDHCQNYVGCEEN